MADQNNNNNEFIRGRWNKISIKNKKRIKANYDKIKDWKIDPKGYFLINVDKKNNLIRAGYCTIPKNSKLTNHEMVAEVVGNNAIEIVNTLIKKKFLSSLQHAGDMGIELCKAELSLKFDLEYIQDKDLKVK